MVQNQVERWPPNSTDELFDLTTIAHRQPAPLRPLTTAKRFSSILLMLSSTLVVEFKQTSQALAGADFTKRLADPVRWRWKQNHIRLPLMVSFVVKMLSVIGKHVVAADSRP